MEENKQLPIEVVECINNWIVTFALAYHKRKDKDISNDVAEFITDELSMPNALTAYATKLHQANETIKELERQNEKLKATATGWRPLLEDILRDNNNGYIDIDEALCSRIKKFLYGE